jgi:hypothetical protein
MAISVIEFFVAIGWIGISCGRTIYRAGVEGPQPRRFYYPAGFNVPQIVPIFKRELI